MEQNKEQGPGATGEVAKDLVELYAARQQKNGYQVWKGHRMAEGI